MAEEILKKYLVKNNLDSIIHDSFEPSTFLNDKNFSDLVDYFTKLFDQKIAAEKIFVEIKSAIVKQLRSQDRARLGAETKIGKSEKMFAQWAALDAINYSEFVGEIFPRVLAAAELKIQNRKSRHKILHPLPVPKNKHCQACGRIGGKHRRDICDRED